MDHLTSPNTPSKVDFVASLILFFAASSLNATFAGCPRSSTSTPADILGLDKPLATKGRRAECLPQNSDFTVSLQPPNTGCDMGYAYMTHLSGRVSKRLCVCATVGDPCRRTSSIGGLRSFLTMG